jgi:CD2 antigen cytoplasmic tail-binding protein 2
MSKRTRPDDGPSKRTRFESPSRSETTNPTAAAAAAAPAVDFLQDDVTTSTRNKDRRSLKDASGYESDSTDDEGETVVPSRKGKLGNKKDGMEDDEDEDMFGGASDAEEADLKSGKGKGKEKTDKSKAFLNLTDIEGQDFGRKSGNYIGERDDDDDDDDDDYDSEEEARKATQGTGLDGPMGVELTAFNMKSELGEGRMTADGESYSVNDRDVGEQYDRWLEGTDRAAVRKARRAKREQERLESERQAKEQEEKTSGGRKQREERLMREMVALLERGETVLEGLQRVGSELEKQRKQVVEGDEKIKRKKLTWAEKQRERRAILEGKPSGSGSGPNDMQVDE